MREILTVLNFYFSVPNTPVLGVTVFAAAPERTKEPIVAERAFKSLTSEEFLSYFHEIL